MSLFNRLEKVERMIEIHKELFPDKPDFHSWSDAELKNYIHDMTEAEHIKNGIFSFEQALEIYTDYLERGLFTKEEFNLYMEIEKDFWDEKGKEGIR